MEQMLRLLGIRAVQKHVYGRTDKAPLSHGDNGEKLWLNFARQGYSLNWGEGTKPKFQVWSATASRGCELSAAQSGAGDPFAPVPTS